MVRQTTPLPRGCTDLFEHASNADLTCAQASLDLTRLGNPLAIFLSAVDVEW